MKRHYLICIFVTTPAVLFLLNYNGVHGNNFPFFGALMLGLIVVFLLTWLLQVNKPMEEIFRIALKSFLVVVVANISLIILLAFLFLLSAWAGWWNR